MAKYSSRAVTVNRSAEQLAEQFSDFRRLQDAIDKIPPSEKAKIGDVSFTEDTINIHTSQVGDITLEVASRTPEQIVLHTRQSPVPMALAVNFRPVGPESTEVSGDIDVDLPVFLKPMIGPTLQKCADQFGELFARLA